MSGIYASQRKAKAYRHRVQTTLSRQSVFVLAGLCLLGIGIVVFLAATDIFPPQHQPTKPQLTQDAITYEAMFREIGQKYNLDWRILACQAYYESEFDPYAVGVNHDAGLMQILPGTWEEWAPRVGVTDPHDPYSNVLVAAAYLAFLRDYFAERDYPGEHWMLVAYNWGPYNLQQFLDNGGRWTDVPEARRRYASNILRSASDAPPGWEVIRHKVVNKTVFVSEVQPVNEKEGYVDVE